MLELALTFLQQPGIQAAAARALLQTCEAAVDQRMALPPGLGPTLLHLLQAGTLRAAVSLSQAFTQRSPLQLYVTLVA